MDLTAKDLDFYSHHFYENIGSLGAPYRPATYTNYLMGRLETILNMFAAHMDGTKNRKPILITECGSLQPGLGPSDYWLRIRSFNGYLMKFMQRPDQIRIVVPFAFLHVPWNPNSGNAAFIPKPNRKPPFQQADYQRTPVADYFELWKDFDGKRLAFNHDNELLDVVPVFDGNKVHVAIFNMSPRRRSVKLSGFDSLKLQTAIQRRLFYHDGQIQKENRDCFNESNLEVWVDVGETTIVTIQLAQRVEPKSNVTQRRFMSAETAVEINNQPQEFLINLPDAPLNPKIIKAELRNWSRSTRRTEKGNRL